ncbi:MAG: hypothetical protein CLLPBCKN_007029 [Chroococcidiopsis cubana SAG 39.79]|nr:hypothetical protein [Chroococcidiopsis sp. SAG 2025]MDZ4877594.1 hypothetical protein [Chroococcidiopsis cubana SAG 39.79]
MQTHLAESSSLVESSNFTPVEVEVALGEILEQLT